MTEIKRIKAKRFKNYQFGGQILGLPEKEQAVVYRELLNKGKITPIQYQMLMDFPEKTNISVLSRKRLLLDELIRFGYIKSFDKLVDQEIGNLLDKPTVVYVPNPAFDGTISSQYHLR